MKFKNADEFIEHYMSTPSADNPLMSVHLLNAFKAGANSKPNLSVAFDKAFENEMLKYSPYFNKYQKEYVKTIFQNIKKGVTKIK